MPRLALPANVLTILALVASVWSGQAGGQEAVEVPGRALLRQLYGDLAFDVRAAGAGAGAIQLGVADSRRSIAVTLLASDVRRWADSVTKVLAARPPRRGQSARWEAVVAGPGVAAGSMALARSVAPGDTSIALLVTDVDFVGVRTNLTIGEARSLAASMRRVANAVLAPPRRPPRP